MLRSFCLLIVAALALSFDATIAMASRPSQSPKVATDPAETGPDFDFQGEWVGEVTGGYHRQRAALQVLAEGEDQLSAVEYRGGLPGAGWDGNTKSFTSGVWQRRLATLDGPERQVAIMNHGRDRELWLYDRDGARCGIFRKVTRRSPTLGAPPPPGAIVLFDGGSTEELVNARVTEDGLLAEGALTKRSFQDMLMHVEFRTPYMPAARGQGRGNSGVYIQQRYEVQILDSFALEGSDNECGGLYKTRPPDVNMCLPPLTWQTYDIEFRAPRFDAEGNKIAGALLTVYHNGVLIHNRVEIPNKTGGGRQEGPDARPTLFQNHRDPVRFRNIWVVDLSRPSASSTTRYAAAAGRPVSLVTPAQGGEKERVDLWADIVRVGSSRRRGP